MTTAAKGPCSADDVETRSARTDELIRAAYAGANLSGNAAMSVSAVGGYGRRELFPYSDVDLLLLSQSVPSGAEKERVSEFLRSLWDSGLRIGHSFHSPADCCEIHEGNLELTISLLDRRLLCGDPAPYGELERLFPAFLASERANIVPHLARMTRGRHARYGNTIYHLEPNVKEHPGALRDLHVVHWLRRLKEFEMEAVDSARDFLFGVRAELHLHYRRDNNLLSFEAQDAIRPEPERWMREYYRNARRIHRAAVEALEICEGRTGGLFANLRERRQKLSTTDFSVIKDQVYLRQPGQLQGDPTLALRLFTFMARHQLPLARDTQRRVSAMSEFGCEWAALRELLSLPRCANAVRAMAELGPMQLSIPEWRRIDCLVVRDFYHRYTVDEHTLVAVAVLDQLPVEADPGPARFGRLLSEIGQPELIRMALILHDIGKGEGGGDHAEKSADIARAALDRLRVPEAEKRTILFLIERHLALSAVMTSRDLSEPSTARHIADAVGTIERLKLLTLLTYADISAVNPTAMTPWRLEQLWKTYLAGQAELTRELETERIDGGNVPAEAAAFLRGFPTRYLKTHTPAEIAGHLELARSGAGVHLAKRDGLYRLTAVSQDRPFLLAAIAGVLASFGMNIVKAEAFHNARAQTLDTFVFADPHRTLELNPEEWERLRDTVLRAMAGKVDIEKLMLRRARPVSGGRTEPRVSCSAHFADASTLVEVVAADRPGLLYDLARTISSVGANIEVVLIDTEAHRALDVFYVTSGGAKLTALAMEQLKERLLAVCR